MSGTTGGSGLRITLRDIALLAKVQRPVVSMWRSRSRHTGTPFPAPVDAVGTQELFDAIDITSWLQTTARGNNPHAAEDVAAFATLPGPDAKRAHFTGLTALLTLRCLTDSRLGALSAEDLLDSADECDPDDAFLFTEIAALGGELSPLAAYADLLTDASYTAEAAFEQLLADRFHSGMRALVRTTLTAEAVELVAATAIELAAGSIRPPVFMDDGGGDFLHSVADMLGEAEPAVLSVGRRDDGPARLARRRLAVHGAHKENLQVVDAAPADFLAGFSVRLAQFPSPSLPTLGAGAILTAIDNIALELDDSSAAVVLAPASVLADSLPGVDRAASQTRADVLRSGRVRAIVRLPQGMLKPKPREAQALWVLGPAHQGVPIADRWTMVADLTGVRLSEGIRADVVGDLAASMGGLEEIRAHSFRFARLVLTRTLLAGTGALTASATPSGPLSPASAPAGSAATGLLAAEQLRDSLNASKRNHLSIELAPGSHPAMAPATIESLLAAGALKYLPGHRLAGSSLGTRSTAGAQFTVIGVEELTGISVTGSRRIDQLDFVRNYPRGRLTEPGDVIFATGAQLSAMVDEEGAAVVLYPARILRISTADPGGLVPAMLVHDIRQSPAGNWRHWRVRRIGRDAGAALQRALTAVAVERGRVAVRLQRLDALSGALMDGAADGSIEVLELGTTTEGTS
ncbi:hypothetical protein [Specibacter sp. RAF43]|uniref:hypothetical protein n=1 Tax=Specibacter sp. RAF43 TaxID=3233057 RepID=UPI003F9B3BF5